jgi:hypothetical protein
MLERARVIGKGIHRVLDPANNSIICINGSRSPAGTTAGQAEAAEYKCSAASSFTLTQNTFNRLVGDKL